MIFDTVLKLEHFHSLNYASIHSSLSIESPAFYRAVVSASINLRYFCEILFLSFQLLLRLATVVKEGHITCRDCDGNM